MLTESESCFSDCEDKDFVSDELTKEEAESFFGKFFCRRKSQ